MALEGLDREFELAKKYNVKIVTGTDFAGSMEAKTNQRIERSNRLKWFTPAETLKHAWVNNAGLLALSGQRNRCPGKLGVIEEGALADLLPVDGNPLENVHLFDDPEKNLLMIM